jgi:hypothetical protein
VLVFFVLFEGFFHNAQSSGSGILRKYHLNIKEIQASWMFSSIGLFGRVILSEQIKQWS